MPSMARLACFLLAFAPEAAAQPPPLPGERPAPGDVVVVTASRREEELINAPATMTVIGSAALSAVPSQNVIDWLRLVPGINAVQTSARDVNVTSRTDSSTLANSLLVLLDGRSIYQDFFGIVMWDFLPIDVDEIKQVEVIRGPASAVWGANALTGVVNVIGKTPREMLGTALSVRFGQFNRTRPGEDYDGGGLFSIHAVHAAAPSQRLAYKISGGVMAQEAFLRPSGNIAGSESSYPDFDNRGTRQPRIDARADYDLAGSQQKVVLAGGMAGTEGIIHTGLGPLDIQRGSMLAYGRVTYTRKQLKVQGFVNFLNGGAPFLLQLTAEGDPVGARFRNRALDVEFSNLNLLGTRHVVSYGGNYRHNGFDLSIAARGDSRREAGVYVQDQIFLSERFRWVLGTRIDRFEVLDKPVFSPRTAFIMKPSPQQTVRLSFNRAFRAPSFVNSYFDIAYQSRLDLGGEEEFRFPTQGIGNSELKEEALSAYEAGYIGDLGPITLGASVYVNRTRNRIFFLQTRSYTSTNPPPGWPLPLADLDARSAAGHGLGAEFSYRNFDRITYRGAELSVEAQRAGLTAFANYTWQGDPTLKEIDPSEINLPPTHRVNAGITLTRPRYYGSISASFQDEAFWQDVLDARFAGWTKPIASINASIGVAATDGTMRVGVRATNLLNSSTQEHIFGDLIRRSVTGEVRLTF